MKEVEPPANELIIRIELMAKGSASMAEGDGYRLP